MFSIFTKHSICRLSRAHITTVPRLLRTVAMARPDVPIPKAPRAPYPITERNVKIVAGFGRGSSELGIPTANVSTKQVSKVTTLDPGVYFGFAKVGKSDEHKITETKQRENGTDVDYKYGYGLKDGEDLNVVLPMVMSIGWNPFYGNKEKAVELHIIHEFPTTFYGASVSFNVLGYIRPELNYTTKGEFPNALTSLYFSILTILYHRSVDQRHSNRYQYWAEDFRDSRISTI